MLKGAPSGDFVVDVRRYLPRGLGPCPEPQWLKTLLKDGSKLDFHSLIRQCGRHFELSIRRDVYLDNKQLTRRQRAVELAWYIVSMLEPAIDPVQTLTFQKISDPDIRRIASEILGVGAGIQLLRTTADLDLRTVKKISSDFDFEGRLGLGAGRTLLEFKGAFSSGSASSHKNSIKKKLSRKYGASKKRSYSSTVCTIFYAWSDDEKRGADFQIVDPPGEGERGHDREHQASILDFFARQTSLGGLDRGAKLLDRVAAGIRSGEGSSSFRQLLGAPNRRNWQPLGLARVSQNVGGQIYVGSYWRAEYLPLRQLGVDIEAFPDLKYAFYGFAWTFIEKIRQGQLDEIPELRLPSSAFLCTRGVSRKEVLDPANPEANAEFRAYVSTDSNGTLLMLSNMVLAINWDPLEGQSAIEVE